MGKRRKGGVEYCPGFTDVNGIWNNGFPCPRWDGPDRSYCCGHDRNRYCCSPPEEPSGGDRGDNTGSGGTGSRQPEVSEEIGSIDGGATDSTTTVSGGGAGESSALQEHIPLIAGACAGALVLFIIIIIICCCCCRKCPLGKKRKQGNRGGSPQCPGCRHQGQMPVVIANDNGSTRQCTLGECPPNANPNDASYCTVCREDGLRWQLGMNEMDTMYPLDDPPPYTVVGEEKEEGKRDQQYGSSFRSFMGSGSDITSGTSSTHTTLGPRDPRATPSGSVPRMTIIRTDGNDGRPKYVMAPRENPDSTAEILTQGLTTSISSGLTSDLFTNRTAQMLKSISSQPGGGNTRRSLLMPSEEGPDVIPRH